MFIYGNGLPMRAKGLPCGAKASPLRAKGKNFNHGISCRKFMYFCIWADYQISIS